jgi:hypothetical protein
MQLAGHRQEGDQPIENKRQRLLVLGRLHPPTHNHGAQWVAAHYARARR